MDRGCHGLDDVLTLMDWVRAVKQERGPKDDHLSRS
jgi:hypothetical protein